MAHEVDEWLTATDDGAARLRGSERDPPQPPRRPTD
jgi:hypothetical protein